MEKICKTCIREFACSLTDGRHDTCNDWDGGARAREEATPTEEIEQTELEQILQPIYRYVNWAEVARVGFEHTPTWLHQRIHGWHVNGKPAEFTQDEREGLSQMLFYLAGLMENIAHKL